MTKHSIKLHMDGLATAILLACYPFAAWIFLEAFTHTIGQ